MLQCVSNYLKKTPFHLFSTRNFQPDINVVETSGKVVFSKAFRQVFAGWLELLKNRLNQSIPLLLLLPGVQAETQLLIDVNGLKAICDAS